MISVIVPVYKVEKYISRCIESVIAQEYDDWELILVDDCSPDRSGEICDEYAQKDSRIRVIHQENQGVSAARNRGIEEARGEYICFIDSDDYVTSQYLRDFTPADEVDFELQGMTLVYEEETFRNHEKRPNLELLSDVIGLLESDNQILDLLNGPCCKLFKKNIIRDNSLSFPQELSYGEDSIFVLSYLTHCKRKIHLIPSSNYFYTHEKTSSSLSSKHHDGFKLYKSVCEDFSWYRNLEYKHKYVPQTYTYYYKNYKALIYYNSLYSVLVSSYPFLQKLHFFNERAKIVDSFFKSAKDLPMSYRVIRLLDKYLPNFGVVLLFPILYRVMK